MGAGLVIGTPTLQAHTFERVLIMTTITQEQLDQWESQHKRILHVVGKNNAWEVVLRKPTRAEYKMFRSNAHDKAKLADAQEILARQIVLSPDAVSFDALLDDYPGIPEAIGPYLADLVGAVGDEQGK